MLLFTLTMPRHPQDANFVADDDDDESLCHSNHVHFDPTVNVIPIPSRSQLTDDDKAKIWFSASELHLKPRHEDMFEHDFLDWSDLPQGDDADHDSPGSCQTEHEPQNRSFRQAWKRPRLRRSDAFEPDFLEKPRDMMTMTDATASPRPLLRRSNAFEFC